MCVGQCRRAIAAPVAIYVRCSLAASIYTHYGKLKHTKQVICTKFQSQIEGFEVDNRSKQKFLQENTDQTEVFLKNANEDSDHVITDINSCDTVLLFGVIGTKFMLIKSLIPLGPVYVG